jgi:hypothetical protein
MGNLFRLWLLSLLVLTAVAACENAHKPSPYEGTFINRGGGP